MLQFPANPLSRELKVVANIKSQIKRNRQTPKRAARNQALSSEMKTRTSTVLATAEAGDAEAAEQQLRIAHRKIDQAANQGVLHANTAARRKAQLVKRVRSLLSGS